MTINAEINDEIEQAPPDAAPTPPGDLHRRAMTASLWVVASEPLKMVVQIARSMILTRLLIPEAFGLMALVQVVLQGLLMCSDLGVGPMIVRHRNNLDENFLSTIWTVEIVRTAILFVIACLLAWPAARFYNQPMLILLIPACALNVMLSSFRSTVTDAMSRNLEQGRLQIFNYAISLIGTFAVIAIAYVTRSVWALVFGTMIETFVYTVCSHFLAGSVRHRFRWDRKIVDELAKFGRWIMISTILTFFAQQIDRILLGKLVSATTLGIYAIAMVLVLKPRDLVLDLSGTVLFPVLSEHVREDSARLSEKVKKARSMLLLLGTFGLAAAGFGAKPFFLFLYDPRYWDAAWMAQLSLFVIWAGILQKSAGYALLALGDSRSLALSNGVQIVASVICCILGRYFLDLPGFILGLGVGTMVSEFTLQLALRRHGIGIIKQDAFFTLATGAYIGFGIYCLNVFAPGSAIADRVKGIVIAFLLLMPVGLIIGRRLWPIVRHKFFKSKAT